MTNYLSGEQVARIINATRDNDQIWYAAGMTSILERLFDRTRPLLEQTADSWREFLAAMAAKNGGHQRYGYPSLRKRLEDAGYELLA
jgi:hypothetical protein